MSLNSGRDFSLIIKITTLGMKQGAKKCVTANTCSSLWAMVQHGMKPQGPVLFTRRMQLPMELVPGVLLPHAQPWLCYVSCAGTGHKRSGNCSVGTPETICKWGQILHVLPSREITKRLRGWKPAGGRCAIALLPCAWMVRELLQGPRQPVLGEKKTSCYSCN